jgi:hypothetical protein
LEQGYGALFVHFWNIILSIILSDLAVSHGVTTTHMHAANFCTVSSLMGPKFLGEPEDGTVCINMRQT